MKKISINSKSWKFLRSSFGLNFGLNRLKNSRFNQSPEKTQDLLKLPKFELNQARHGAKNISIWDTTHIEKWKNTCNSLKPLAQVSENLISRN